MRRLGLSRSLSGKILLLTICFVLVGEVLIFIPSIARFRREYLLNRIEAAYLATIALDSEEAARLDEPLKAKLLNATGVTAITLHRPMAQLMLGSATPHDRVVDLRHDSAMRLIPDAIESLLAGGSRTLQVIAPAPSRSRTLVDIIMPETQLWNEMVDYSARILLLSVVLSVGVALLLFLSLELMIVRPLRTITMELAAFRERPEDATLDAGPNGRRDEIGVVERELTEMRLGLRRALLEKTRLAALGEALGRMSHDLRNLLATAVLVSDRLETSPDPQVRRVAPLLVGTLERATRLCADTLDYARSRPASPTLQPARLLEVVERVRSALDEEMRPVRWRIDIDPGLEVMVDADQLHRVLLNLARNACEAMGENGGELRIQAMVDGEGLNISVADTGPGVPERVRAHLFEPFAGTTKTGGSGLGLAICRELMRAQGGDISLQKSRPGETIFDLQLPARAVLRGERSRSRAMNAVRLLLLLPLLLAGCAGSRPLAAYPGAERRLMSYYEDRAFEENATCPNPRMTSARSQIVEETPSQLVMNVRYHWRDETQIDSWRPPHGGGMGHCDGWGERTFVLAKNTGGGLDVVSMSGLQQQR